ncbi:putative phage abortive infection protein [Undibacterium arcticum]|uniref:Phage abortive infection protein n=1 Tax=Undibacterium arcticum TaxID=1762892 RepID=A0ABV7F6S3_9BURK
MNTEIEIANKQLKKQTKNTLFVALAFTGILPISYLVWFGIINKVPMETSNAATWGAFGDFVGGILNPLVAFFALYWLTRSIEIQREELSATKIELAQAKLAQQDQARTLEKQRFEDTFFSLLNQHNAVLTSFTSVNPKNSGGKSDAEYIRDAIFWKKSSLQESNAALKKHDDRCGHYFRILYQLLKLIATRNPNTSFIGPYNGANILSPTVSDDEKLYSNIVRAFLNIEVTQGVLKNQVQHLCCKVLPCQKSTSI